MKRENKKALSPSRVDNRARVITDLVACVAKLRVEVAAKDKRIAELETLLNAARSSVQS